MVRAVSSSKLACTFWGFEGWQAAKVLLQPSQVEHFSAGAFWAFCQEKRVAEQSVEQLRFYFAAGCPLAVAIKVFAAL